MALTWYVPGDVKVHESDEVPGPVTLDGEMLQDVLLVVRATTPAKPFKPVTATVEVPAEPAFTVTLVGDGTRVKSWTTNVTVTE